MSTFTAIFINVYRGPLRDDTKASRHTALFVREPGKRPGTLIHASNLTGPWAVQMKIDYNPFTSINIVGQLPVAEVSRTHDDVTSIISTVPIGKEVAWNCQNWVGEALQKLVDEGVVTAKQRSDGISKMVDVLLESEDDAVDKPLK